MGRDKRAASAWFGPSRKVRGPVKQRERVNLTALRAGFRWVGQEHPNGCVAACTAMLLGVSYAEAAEMLAPYRHADGVYSTVRQYQFLRGRGWRVEPIYTDVGAPKPDLFAPVHFYTVKVAETSTVYHQILCLLDGTILDPMTTEPRTLDSYFKVGGLTGLFPPQAKDAADV